MRRSSVLVVDDNRANLLVIEAVLGGEHDLIYAPSGQRAIDAVRARDDIDLILMDVHMPIMDGFEAALRIREIPERRDIPIVFVTAVHSDDPSVRRGYAVGGIDYFSKPFDPALLRRKVAAYVAMRRLERECVLDVRVGVIIATEDGAIHLNDPALRMLSEGDAASAMQRWGDTLRDLIARKEGSEIRIEGPDGKGTLRLRVSQLCSTTGARTGSVIVCQRT